jgi:uncharacterized membrane protein
MSTLIVVTYDDPYKGEEVRLKLRKLQSEYLLDLDDAVVAVKDEKGRVKLHLVTITGAGAFSGGFLGMLVGLIFLSPLLGFAIGAAVGAASVALSDVGINDHIMKELAAATTPGSSTLFVLVRKATPEKVLEELTGTGGKVLKTSLSHEDEAKLQAALSASRRVESPSRQTKTSIEKKTGKAVKYRNADTQNRQGCRPKRRTLP